MAEPQDEDVLELDDEQVVEDELQDDGEERDEDNSDDVETVSFGDEAEPRGSDSELIKSLRQQLREKGTELSRLRKAPEQEAEIVVGDRPTLEECDYDQERFDQAFDEWEQRRDAKRDQDKRREQRQQQQGQEWEQVQRGYQDKKANLTFADKDQAEATAFEALSTMQQAVIAKVAPDPALLVYALGKNPAKLNQLAALENPLELAAAIGRMGATLKTGKTSRAPEPERVERGRAPSTARDKTLERLEKKADRTGNRTDLIRYKKEQKDKAK